MSFRGRLGSLGVVLLGAVVLAGCLVALPGAPPSVTSLQVTSVGPTSLTLSWDNPESSFWGVVVRRAEGATPPTSPSEWPLVWDGGDTTSFTDTNVSQGTTYSYAVFTRGALTYYSTAATVTATTTVRSQLHAGQLGTCAIADDGTVHCWGSVFPYDPYGSRVPEPVPGISDAVAVDAGPNGNPCALLAGGSVICWDTVPSPTPWETPWNPPSAVPTPVPGVSSATAISIGFTSACALISDGTLRCWGDNTYGQLGDGTTVSSATPVPVAGITTATSVATYRRHTCARLGDGSVRCWGSNIFGELGNGTTTPSLTPVPVPGISTATAVAVGDYYACARLADGALRCWGLNNYGQLGNGTTTNALTPVAVSGVSTATVVATGSGYGCAVLSDGTLRCWGKNLFGRLGVNGDWSSTTPVPVVGISTATDVTTGYWHACARVTDGGLWCWGSNEYGQLGNDSLEVESWVPVAVPDL